MAFPHHEELYIENFTTFALAKFTFSPTINVLVGENGTGKTHLMKVLYAIHLAHYYYNRRNLEVVLKNVFQSPNLGYMVRVGLYGARRRTKQCDTHRRVSLKWRENRIYLKS